MATRILFLLSLISLVFADASWKRVDTINQYIGRGETSFSKCGDEKLCLIGGRGANRVSILDTKALVWSPGKTGPFEMHHFQALMGPDGCVWIAGAWTDGFPDEDTVNNIWAYCRSSDEWEKRAEIPRPRGAGGAVFYKGKLYIVSGNVGGHNPDAKVVPWFDCYDPATGEWTELPDVPNPRDHFHVVVIGSKLYVAGGRFSTADVPELFSKVAKNVDVYDFETGKWSALSDLPRPRGGVAATEYDSTVMLLGGESERSSAWTEVDILRDDKFVPFEDMPDPRHGTGAVTCNGAVWIAGGVRVQGGGDASVETYALFDGDTPPVCSESTNVGTSSPPTTSTMSTGTSTANTETSSDAPVPSASPSSSNSGGDNNAASDETAEPSTAEPSTAEPSTAENDATAVDDEEDDDDDPSEEDDDEDPSEEDDDDDPSEEDDDEDPSEEDDDDDPSEEDDDDDPSEEDDDDDPSEENEETSSNATGDSEESASNASQSPSEQTETDSDSGPACFPSIATVQLEDGTIKNMEDLRIGDRVKVAHPDEYSEVFFFSHRHPTIVSKSVRIDTSIEGVSLTLSPGHIIYANGISIPASTVKVGDVVRVSHEDHEDATVTKISGIFTNGLHNPHTLHGDIIVNRVVTSTYTSTVHPSIARVLLLPLKAAYTAFGATPTTESLNIVILRTLDLTFWRR